MGEDRPPKKTNKIEQFGVCVCVSFYFHSFGFPSLLFPNILLFLINTYFPKHIKKPWV